MSCLRKIIDAYCLSLEAIGWNLPDLISGNDPTTALLKEDLQPIESIVDFFQWQNGVDDKNGQTIDQLYIFPGYYLISLQEAIEIYRSLVDSQYYGIGLFPILASGGGDYYLIDLRPNSDKPGAIYKLLEGYFPAQVFSNLCNLFITYKKCIAEGIIYIAEKKYLEMDDRQFSRVAAEVNPEITFWND